MKKTILLLFTLFIMFVGIAAVGAKEQYATSNGEVQILANKTIGTANDKQCQSLFGNPNKQSGVKHQDLAYYLQTILTILKYVGIVLCIVLTIVDFSKALLGEEKDMYKPLAKKGLARLIYACCLFFLPYLVKVVLTLVGVYGTCGIG